MSQHGTEPRPGHDEEPDESGLRRRMLDSAQRLVEQDGGLTVSLENLGMDRVIKEAGVSRTSVYREWSNKEAFYVDLLCDLGGPSWQGTAAFDDETIELARNVVADHLADLSSPLGRDHLLHEVIRVAAKRNFEAITVSTQWRTYVALTATALGLPDADARGRVQEALQTAESGFLANMADFYEDMAIVLGYRLKSHIESYTILAAVGASIVEGLALRQMLLPDILSTPIKMPSSDEDWHLAAMSFLNVIEAMIEPDPAYEPQMALAEYLKRLAGRERTVGPG